MRIDEANPNRRDFLKRSALVSGAIAELSAADLAASPAPRAKQCILLMLTGGPSQIDTWDPKPLAPSAVRGPFQPIRTSVPGLHFSECFPHMAEQAHRLCVVRSMYHDADPIHETGLQLMQTGYLATDEVEYPHFNVVSAHRNGKDSYLLGGEITRTGLNLSRGQSVGFLSEARQSLIEPSDASFDIHALAAAGPAEFGHFSTVNAHGSLLGGLSWDCHADGGSLPTTLEDYRREICPRFDYAFTQLLDWLERLGHLDTTLVIAMGEMGRTPYLNSRGGRDHWTRAWSIILAGGGVPGGAVIGATDRLGGEPTECPVHPRQLVATIYRLLGVDLSFDGRFDELRRTPSIPGLL